MISRSESLDGRSGDLRRLVDARLDALIPEGSDSVDGLASAMRYSLLAPGKRIRPILALWIAESLGGTARQALDPACAIEMVHTASLMLDDLPSMDDAELRRGRPTAHREFGEDTATLAAIGLMNRAFEVISEAPQLTTFLRLELVRLLSTTIGPGGLVTGQARDLEEPIANPGATALEETYRQKTSVLFGAAAETGARVAGARDADVEALRRFTHDLGLIFQIRDDLLDRVGRPEDTGKECGQDRDKQNLVSLLGESAARDRMKNLAAGAHRALLDAGITDSPILELSRSLLDFPAGTKTDGAADAC